MGRALDDSTYTPYSKTARHRGDAQEKTRGDTRADTRDWRKGMSDNVALAMIVYTGLQIFVTVRALREGLPSILPYLALVLLVVAIIPACRWFEKRWMGLSEVKAHDAALAGAYRRDQLALWSIAIGLPFAIAFGFRAFV